MRAPIHKYTDEQREFVRDNIKGRTRKEMTEMFNQHFNTDLKVTQITSFIKRNGFISGLDGRFEKGQYAWNKGMKGLNLGGEKGWFEKGQTPHNYQALGSERVNSEGYTDIKVADPNVWKQKHRIIWEKANGPIPKGHVVIFGDGDRRNFELDNLILISRRQLSFMNKKGLIQNDADLTKTGIIIADIYSKMSEIKKANEK